MKRRTFTNQSQNMLLPEVAKTFDSIKYRIYTEKGQVEMQRKVDMHRQGEDAFLAALMLIMVASIGLVMWIALIPGLSLQETWEMLLKLLSR